ncbi:unnamed protein product [Linum trigynum]|uniref:Uncharacterized protein n=1 Tax=Linum trigynum TaxID=586398 RepID=A0AAV2FT78_9ROSI
MATENPTSLFYLSKSTITRVPTPTSDDGFTFVPESRSQPPTAGSPLFPSPDPNLRRRLRLRSRVPTPTSDGGFAFVLKSRPQPPTRDSADLVIHRCRNTSGDG